MLLRAFASFIPGLFCLASYGQSVVPGYVVTAGQDSLRGVIYIHEDYAQQGLVEFVTMQGNQRLQLNASQLKAYGYIHKKDTIRYVATNLSSDPKSGATNRVFLRQLAAGPVELYQYYYTSKPTAGRVTSTGTGIDRTTGVTQVHPRLYQPQFTQPEVLVPQFFAPLSINSARFGIGTSLLVRRRAQQTIAEVTWWDFPTDAAAYFADCPALAADLQAKLYKPRDIHQVVKRYNIWHATEQQGR